MGQKRYGFLGIAFIFLFVSLALISAGNIVFKEGEIYAQGYYSRQENPGLGKVVSFLDNNGDNHSLTIEEGLVINHTINGGDGSSSHFGGKSYLENGLIVYYNFTNMSSNGTRLLESSQGVHNGSLNASNPPTWSGNGKLGQSLFFDSLNEEVYIGTVNSSETVGAFSFWVNMSITATKTSQRARVIEFNDGGTEALTFGAVSGELNDEYISITDTSGTRWDSGLCDNSNYISGDLWRHIVWTWNSTDYEIWIDGVNQVDDYCVYGNPTKLSLNNFDLSSSATSDIYYRGHLDELGIWDRSLSSSEIADLYNNGTGLAY